jgi:hypothetical protein
MGDLLPLRVFCEYLRRRLRDHYGASNDQSQEYSADNQGKAKCVEPSNSLVAIHKIPPLALGIVAQQCWLGKS